MRKVDEYLKYARLIIVEKKKSLRDAEKRFGRDYPEFYRIYLQLIEASKPALSQAIISIETLQKLNSFVARITKSLKQIEDRINSQVREFEKV